MNKASLPVNLAPRAATPDPIRAIPTPLMPVAKIGLEFSIDTAFSINPPRIGILLVKGLSLSTSKVIGLLFKLFTIPNSCIPASGVCKVLVKAKSRTSFIQ